MLYTLKTSAIVSQQINSYTKIEFDVTNIYSGCDLNVKMHITFGSCVKHVNSITIFSDLVSKNDHKKITI